MADEAETRPDDAPSERSELEDDDDEGEDGEDETEGEDEEDDEESMRSEDAEDETSACSESEEKYENQPAAGLSPRKVLKRAAEVLKEDERANPTLRRVDTFSDFERTVDSSVSVDYAAPLPALQRVDTFGQSMSAAGEAAARARGGRAIPRLGAASSMVPMPPSALGVPADAAPTSLQRMETLSSHPAVADALSAVDEEGSGLDTEVARVVPVTRSDTLDLLQYPPQDVDEALPQEAKRARTAGA
tara:strand:+ start:889 stop:1626 length:738 start_codon:yes stop_codon:yes gene_type:complete